MMVAEPLHVVPELPDGWVPEPALVFAFIKDPGASGEPWEVVLPAWTIVSRGDTFGEALVEANELLEDYLRMCAAEGKTFEQSRRPIGARWQTSLILRALAGAVSSRLHYHVRRRSRVARFPLDGRSAHFAL